MKRISVIISPMCWDSVRLALNSVDIHDIDVTEVLAFGRTGGVAFFGGARYLIDHVPQAKVEVTVRNAMASRVIRTIESSLCAKDYKLLVTRLLDDSVIHGESRYCQTFLTEKIF